jgi:hypothetical protein
MWEAKNKRDLMIEVWEKLDCESVGAAEIEAIETAVLDVFGESAVDSPMRIARQLADEGAELRHSEIMELHVRRFEETPYTAEFRNILKLDSLARALASIRRLENLRKKFLAEGDKKGIRQVRDRVIEAKKSLSKDSQDAEIAQWLTVWLQTPEAFENWITLRKRSPDYQSRFGDDLK